MRIVVKALTVLIFAACGQSNSSVNDLMKCSRDLGSMEANLTYCKRTQESAEKKAQILEEQLRAAQEELVAARMSAEQAAATASVPAMPTEEQKQIHLKNIRIGLSLPTQREERWIKDKLTMINESRKRGIELKVQISENDAARQIAQCDTLISQKVNALIVAPHDASTASVIIDKAAAAGIPVISYDRLITDSPRDYYYLSFDNVRVGQLQGEYITKKVPKGTYVVLAGAPSDNNAKLFREGAMKIIQPLVDKGDIKVVMDRFVKDWSPAEAQKLCEQALDENKNSIDAILAPNDGTAGGCVQALAARGLAGKVPITGQDSELAAAIRIIQGTQSMTIFKDTRLLGRKAIEMAVDLASGKRINTQRRTVFNNKRNVPSVLLSPAAVTRDNLDKKLIQSGYLNRGAVYRH